MKNKYKEQELSAFEDSLCFHFLDNCNFIEPLTEKELKIIKSEFKNAMNKLKKHLGCD